jgi:hypothetical protein
LKKKVDPLKVAHVHDSLNDEETRILELKKPKANGQPVKPSHLLVASESKSPIRTLNEIRKNNWSVREARAAIQADKGCGTTKRGRKPSLGVDAAATFRKFNAINQSLSRYLGTVMDKMPELD